MRCVVAWKPKTTDAGGRGSTPLSREEARRECERLDREFPGSAHWPESAA